MPVTCPACGSENVKAEKVQGSLPIPYGPPATFIETVHTCNDCGTRADFTGENDAIIKEALSKSAAMSATRILEDLSSEGITQAYFERALRLPVRTTNRWKAGELSAAALALLRMIRTYPWLLDVSDSGFEQTLAASRLVEAAARVFTSVLREKVSAATVDVTATDAQVNVNATLQLSTPPQQSVYTITGGGQVETLHPRAGPLTTVSRPDQEATAGRCP